MKLKQTCYFALFLYILIPNKTKAQNTNIKNDVFWNTVDGKPIYSQGGGIFKFLDPTSGKPKYFWYGVRYKEAELYRANPAITQPKATFEAVTCYCTGNL